MTGIGFLTIGFTLIDELYAWPDIYAAFPVLGATLLLAVGAHHIFRAALTIPPLLIIGRLSYTLYLVHWPVIVIYRYWHVAPISLIEIVVLAIAAIAATIALHILVEVPFRQIVGWHGKAWKFLTFANDRPGFDGGHES